MEEPRLIEGGIGVDDRGMTAFVNDFAFADVKRFYTVRNHQAGFVRAWHAHRRESKYVTVVAGTAIVAAVPIDDFTNPRKDAPVTRVVISANKPAVFFIPAGYANGAMTLTADTVIMYFSTASLAESKGDDIRYDAQYWDAWTVEQR